MQEISYCLREVSFYVRKESFCLKQVCYCLREESVCVGSSKRLLEASKLSAGGRQVLPYRWLGREQKSQLILLWFPDSSIFWALLWRNSIFKSIYPYFHRNYAFSVGFKQNFAWNMLFQHALGETPYIIATKSRYPETGTWLNATIFLFLSTQ